MSLNWSTPPACPWIYNSDHSSASIHRGGVLWIFQRWHDLARPGTWLVTLATVNGVGHWPLCRNVLAVVDDFGTLIPVE